MLKFGWKVKLGLEQHFSFRYEKYPNNIRYLFIYTIEESLILKEPSFITIRLLPTKHKTLS